MAAWDVVLLDPVAAWFEVLLQVDPRTAEQVAGAVVLVAGDEAGRWREWYREGIRLAEARYASWLAGEGDR